MRARPSAAIRDLPLMFGTAADTSPDFAMARSKAASVDGLFHFLTACCQPGSSNLSPFAVRIRSGGGARLLPPRRLAFSVRLNGEVNFCKTRKAGRPATGKTPAAPLRLPEKVSEQIEAWSRKQGDAPTRCKAIRPLVELGLKVKK